MSELHRDAHRHEPRSSSTSSHDHNSWKTLFHFTRKHHVLVWLPATLFSVAAGLLQPAMAKYLGGVFSNFSDYAAGKIDSAEFMEKTLKSIYAIIGIGVSTFILKGGLFSFWLQFGELQARCIQGDLFQTLLEKDLEWYELRTNGVGTLLTRVQAQIRDVQLATSQPLGFSIVFVVQALVALILAFCTNWKLTFVVLASVPLIGIGVALISRDTQRNLEQHSKKLTQASKVASNAITHIVTIKCLNAREQEGQHYFLFLREAATIYLKLGFANALQSGFIRFMTSVMFVQGFWYGGSQVHSGATTAGKVITTFWCCIIALTSLDDILPYVVILDKGRAAAVALKAVLDKVGEGKTNVFKTDGLSPQFCEGDIVMEEVSFAYPSNPGHCVLRESSFCFPAGHTTFLVGKSGCGKSTLGFLLLRFFHPNHGKICIDGIDIRNFDTSWLRNNITLVQQQCYLFSETIFTNIALGRADQDRVTYQEINQCLRVASLETAIADLPEGVMTRVSGGGSSLSGGQKQRVALSRARLRDTPILVLDEATSALDYTTRTAVMENIRKWREGRTTIVITHDLAQIQDEDFVYVLEAGAVVHQGRRKDIADLAKRLTVVETDHQYNSNTVDKGKPSDWFSSQPDATTINNISMLKLSKRKYSFDAEVEATNEAYAKTFSADAGFSGTRQTPKMSLATGAEAALRSLTRQSRGRAKAMYTFAPPSPFWFGTMAITVPQKRVTRHPSLFPIQLSTAKVENFNQDDKPLPIPPLLGRSPGMTEQHRDEDEQGSDQPRSSSSVLAILRTVLPTLEPTQRIKLTCAIIATLGHASAPPIFSYLLAQVLSTFYLTSDYKPKLLMYSLSILAIAMVDGVCCFLKHFLLECVAQSWVDTLRSRAFARTLRQPKGWFDQETNNYPLVVSALDRNAEEMKDLLGKFAAQIMTVVVMMSVAMLWSFATCWKLTLVSLASTPIVYLTTHSFEAVSSRWESRTNTKSEILCAIFVETFADIKTVRALTLEFYFHRKYKSAISDASATGKRRAIYSGFFYGLSDSSVNFLIALMFWYGAHLAKEHEWPVKSIVTVFALVLFCTANATAILAYIPQINSATDTATRLLHLVHMSVFSHEDKGDFQLDVDDVKTLAGPIHFINQTFYYPTRPDVPVLRRLNLTIPSGKCTAIVGASGSGKSTIASLILGLYPPAADELALSPSNYSGGPPSLTLSGRDIRTLDLDLLRSMIAFVPQTPILLSGTVRENITYGIPSSSALIAVTHVEAAARMAGIHEFIQSLPQGYATIVGEGGISVSGGQAQRIVVARAFVRNPRILILDEATSALDHENADIIKNSVVRLINENKGRLTVIMVTHSKAMMKFADQIVVMEQGSAIEQGPYTELLRSRGKLWEMLKAGGALH